MSEPESDRSTVLAELRAEWGLDARVLDRVVAGLRQGATLAELVRVTAAPRRDVEAVLAALDLVAEGDRFRLPALEPLADAVAPVVDPFAVPADPEHAALTATMAEIAAGLPSSLWNLDHVSATPATMAARALFLTREYALAGATLLCVGDHDLTSIAVALAEPAVEVLVVDVDQRLLAYLDEVAAARGLPVTTALGDLRLGLPASFAGRADLAFTDPPYTPEGIGLFVARALTGMRRTGHERVAIAYGFSSHQLTRGFRTQSALHELRLVLEAVLPRFNRFDGAEAIGAAAALYVARPTRFTWPIVDRASGVDPRIYTRGAASAESEPAPLDPATVAAVDAAVPGPDRLLVGDGWPAEAPGRRVSVADFLAGRPGAAAVNLAPHYGAALPAVLLAAAERGAAVAVAAPARDAQAVGPVRDLVAPLLTVTVRSGEPSVVLTRPAEGSAGSDAATVLAWLVTHPGAAVGNAWREALLRVAKRRGVELTKNQARTLVRGSGLPAGALTLRLAELPRHTQAAVVAAVPDTVAGIPDRPGTGGSVPEHHPRPPDRPAD